MASLRMRALEMAWPKHHQMLVRRENTVVLARDAFAKEVQVLEAVVSPSLGAEALPTGQTVHWIPR